MRLGREELVECNDESDWRMIDVLKGRKLVKR